MCTLLQFSVSNFRSIHKTRTLSLVPQSIQDEPKGAVVISDKNKFLTAAAIYGANSSGKSNVVKALADMTSTVLSSVKINDNDPLDQDPFLLSENSAKEPTSYEVIYLNNNRDKIRYGFEYTDSEIVSEWLFVTRSNKRSEETLFVRDSEGIAVNDTLFAEGVDNEERTNDNRLFISLVAQLGGPISKSVISFFQSGFRVISGLSSLGYNGFTEQLIHEDTQEAKEAMQFFNNLKLGFEKVQTESHIVEKQGIKGVVQKNDIVPFSVHNVYDNNGNVIDTRRFEFYDRESAGTEKLFKLAGPLFDTLKNGNLLVVDELDAKMHPLISQQIIRIFADPKTNPNHAQLLFTTHDTNLLSCHLLRRDQIWFTEKDACEATDLYNMMQIVFPDGSKPRSDGNLERNYIKGRYGAIPYFHPDTNE